MRRLLVLCRDRGQFNTWCRHAGLPAYSDRIIGVTRGYNTQKLRGMDPDVAFVVLDDEDRLRTDETLRRYAERRRIFNGYIGLVHAVPSDIDQLKEWLQLPKPRDPSRPDLCAPLIPESVRAELRKTIAKTRAELDKLEQMIADPPKTCDVCGYTPCRLECDK